MKNKSIFSNIYFYIQKNVGGQNIWLTSKPLFRSQKCTNLCKNRSKYVRKIAKNTNSVFNLKIL